MIDVKDFIAALGGDPEKIRDSQRKRHASVELVDEVIAIFEDHKKTQYAATQIGSEINALQKQIGQKKKAKQNADDLVEQKEQLTKDKKAKDAEAADKLKILNSKAKTVGNYVHDSVPVSNNEDDNATIRTWAPDNTKVEQRDCLSHHEVLTRLDGYDPARGVKVAGHRANCLLNHGYFLKDALRRYAIDFLFARGYTVNEPPYFMNQDAMAKTAQLEEFDEALYKIEGSDGDVKYLIATSEQPLSAIHANEWLQDKELPICYAGDSTCFRKEAGSHGKDAWGLFRVHQFQKIEQFVFCKPTESWAEFDRMMDVSEQFYQSLGLPYRVVAIVSGALNNAAAKKYDLEAWFPFQGEYKELVSCSNCTDYQTRELEIRYGIKKPAGADDRTTKVYVHALNATLCAAQRALCCILENYQTAEGLMVPQPLRKWMPGEVEFLPFTKELPKDSTSTRGKGGADGKAATALPVR